MTVVASYPVLNNHPGVNGLLARNFAALFGKGKVAKTEQVLGGEDFAYYVEEVPGAMFRLGVMNKKIKADQPWHSAQFMADEEALVYGSALLASAVVDYQTHGLP